MSYSVLPLTLPSSKPQNAASEVKGHTCRSIIKKNSPAQVKSPLQNKPNSHLHTRHQCNSVLFPNGGNDADSPTECREEEKKEEEQGETLPNPNSKH